MMIETVLMCTEIAAAETMVAIIWNIALKLQELCFL